MGWVCTAALDENAWYVALLHFAGDWACATESNEIAWHVVLLHAAVFDFNFNSNFYLLYCSLTTFISYYYILLYIMEFLKFS